MTLEFNDEHFVNVNKLTREEAIMFCIFLYSERWRHKKDIEDIDIKIKKLEERFNFRTGFESCLRGI